LQNQLRTVSQTSALTREEIARLTEKNRRLEEKIDRLLKLQVVE